MNIAILGLPGSGKGTQSEILAQKLGLFHFSAGELARSLAKTDPRIDGIVKSGGLIPEEEMTGYVSKYLNEMAGTRKNILFEGYPRFISQYEFLNSWLAEKNQELKHVIFLDLSQEEVVKRLSTRRTCEKCERVYNLVTNPPPMPDKCECGGKLYQRSDDNTESIKTRFEVYKKNVQPLIEHLEGKGRLIRIDGSRTISEVTEEILEKIK